MNRLIAHRYEELAQLGQGAQGVVYKVHDRERDTTVVLKALHKTFLNAPEFIARFRREISVLRRLQHMNIVRVLDSGYDETLQLYYFVTEYIEGKPLNRHLEEEHRLPVSEALDIACQVARGLVHAHQQTPPVIHRDIKPANIMIETGSRRAVVLDFGIAKPLGAEEQLTQAGAFLGTVKYCAPEQIQTPEKVSPRVDVYSLGLVLYEMLMGTPFFPGPALSLPARILDGSQENEPTFDGSVPLQVAAMIGKAIAKSPDKRYPSMLDFLQELEPWRKRLVQDEATAVILEHQPAKGSRASRREPVAQVVSTSEQTDVPAVRSRHDDRHRMPSSEIPVFTQDGFLNRARFHAEAFRTLIAATAESQRVGDSQIDVFHLFMSCTRGPCLRDLYTHLNGHTGQALKQQLKILRARVRQAYQRPVVKEKPFVRDLHRTDIASAVLTILDTASRLAPQRQIEEKHIIAALLRHSPTDLLNVLQSHNISLTALQHYDKEREEG